MLLNNTKTTYNHQKMQQIGFQQVALRAHKEAQIPQLHELVFP